LANARSVRHPLSTSWRRRCCCIRARKAAVMASTVMSSQATQMSTSGRGLYSHPLNRLEPARDEIRERAMLLGLEFLSLVLKARVRPSKSVMEVGRRRLAGGGGGCEGAFRVVHGNEPEAVASSRSISSSGSKSSSRSMSSSSPQVGCRLCHSSRHCPRSLPGSRFCAQRPG